MQASEPPARRLGVAVALRLGARASCPWRRDARETPARRSGSRRQDAHSACPGCARLRRACQRGYASGVQAGETPALHSGSRARDARAPFRFMGACASGAHISSACPGCARLRRAWKQRGLALQNSIASAKRLRSLFVPFLPSPRRHNILIQLFL